MAYTADGPYYTSAIPHVASFLCQPNPPPQPNVPANIQFASMITADPALAVMKQQPPCTVIQTPISSVPRLQVTVPYRLFQISEKPPIAISENDLATTCCYCKKKNQFLDIKMTELRGRLSELSELVNFIKNQVQFYPFPIENKIIAPASHPVYRSNLSVDANEFTPSPQFQTKNRAPKSELYRLNNNIYSNNVNNTEECELRPQNNGTMEVSNSGTSVDSRMHDSDVVDSTEIDSVSETSGQNKDNIQNVSGSTESLRDDCKDPKKKSKKNKKKKKSKLDDESNEIDSNQNYKCTDPQKEVRNRNLYGRNNSGSFNLPKCYKTNADFSLREVEGDLFSATEEYSLAHCVAEDFRMGAGIAVQFKNKYGNVAELLDQRKSVGQVAFLKIEKRYIFYLITKRLSHLKPNMHSMNDALISLRKCCEKFDVRKLAIPRLGSGLDKLKWEDVKNMLHSEFQGVSIEIVIYNWKEQDDGNFDGGIPVKQPPMQPKLLKTREVTYPLVDIEDSTAMVVYGTLDGAIDKTCEKLNTKYQFVKVYKDECRKSSIGSVLSIPTRNEIVFVFMIRESASECFSYKNLESCITNFNKLIKKEKYEYVGIEWIDDNEDTLINDKVISVFRCNLFSRVELYICNKRNENNSSTSPRKSSNNNFYNYTKRNLTVS